MNQVIRFRRQEPAHLTRAHGLEMRLLHPWAGLRTPFEGAWCVLRPGDVTDTHDHPEQEIFIAVAGRGELVTGGERHPFEAGDLLTIAPGTTHRTENTSDRDCTYYAIWWHPEPGEQP
jgi:mannose-6-phosphate isomerase-like protein (cupin superfamily)